MIFLFLFYWGVEGTYPFHFVKKHISPNLKSMMAMTCESSIVSPLFLSRICQAKTDPTRAFLLENKFSTITVTASPRQVVSAARLCNPNLATKVVVPWRRKKGRRQQERKSTTCGKVEILLSLAKRHLLLLGLFINSLMRKRLFMGH
ncbi:hypothetical protein D0Y65_031459 [Glycine soja]|uniref:Uncharacterized protein n=1 Tax=Glycine soja TaxID=3848 RepID=A0A445I8C6_GLYSO|nr:hypothetical protein D0Y65_031459 [Glycine soja]